MASRSRPAPAAAPKAPAPDTAAPVRLGVFGGTFDPPHLGHLVIAEWARQQLELERVVFMPSGAPPHKRGRVRTPAAARVAMTRLAVRGNPAFEVSTLETRRPGTSFTVDTLETLAAQSPRARLFLIIGEDSLDEFHTWHEPERILGLATLVVAPRPEPEDRGRRRRARSRALGRRVVWLDNPRLAISSSAIRRLAGAGRSIRYQVPDAVARYVTRRRLYRG